MKYVTAGFEKHAVICMSYVCTVCHMYVQYSICMYMYVICIYRVRVLVSFRNDIRKYIMLGEKKNKDLKTSVAAGLDPARSRLLVARFVSDPQLTDTVMIITRKANKFWF